MIEQKYIVDGTRLHLQNTSIQFESKEDLHEFLLKLLTQTEGLAY